MRTLRIPRFARYAGVSLLATGLAQVGLFIGYGVLRWPVASAVSFSLAVSVGPAYLLNRRYVWPDTANSEGAFGEAMGFLLVALLGSLTTLLIVWMAVRTAGIVTSNHVTLSLVANAASILATGAVWLARYVVLDRVLFAPRSSAPDVDLYASVSLGNSVSAVSMTTSDGAYD